MILTQRLDFALRLLFVGEACPSSSLNFTIQRYGIPVGKQWERYGQSENPNT